ncbi:MAG TPA: LysE family translocator [Pseudonocardiaceae bacterium]|nr:LysE family translocator [Pseudonocardiaceae bacterium]
MPLNYWAYLGFAALVVIAPGPDFAVVMKNSLAHGRFGSRPGLYASFGVVTSLLIQGLAAALGVAALIVHSQIAFTVLKIVGAVYLTYLGIQSLRAALKRRREGGQPPPDERQAPAAPHALRHAYRQGLLSNISNPKVLAFYFSLLPQFVSTGKPALPQVLLLAGTHAVLALLWLVFVVFALLRMRRVFLRTKVRRWLEGVVGVALLGFAAKLAVSSS